MTKKLVLGMTVAVLMLCLVAPVFSGGQQDQAKEEMTVEEINETRPLVVGLPNGITTFETMEISTKTDVSVAEHIFDRLLQLTADAELEPMLATSWELLDDRKTWRFELRDDVNFSNGEHFNAETVKYVIDRGLDKQYNWKGNTPGYLFPSMDLVGAEVVDEYTIDIKASGYQPDLPGYISEVFIHPVEYYKENSLEKVASEPIGSGPYVLKEWVKDDHVTLERRDDYWGETPNLKTLTFRPFPESSTAVAEMINGTVHVISKVPPDQAPMIDEAEGVEMRTVDGGRRIYIGFQQTSEGPGSEAVRDVRVRRALNMAVDIDAILDSLLYGRGEREGGMVNPPHKSEEIKPYPYDPERAKELLAEAGYPNGFKVELATPSGRYTKDKEIALAVGDYLKKVGVEAEVVPYEWSVYVSMIKQKDLPPLYLLGTGSAFLSAWYDLSDLVSLEAATNYVNWQNDEWDRLVQELQTTYDPDEREKITDRLQMIVHEDAPWLFIYMQVDWYAKSSNVDWEPRGDEIMDFKHASFKK